MITTGVSANISIMSHYVFFVGGTIKIWSLSNSEVYNTVLLTVTTLLYIRFPSLISLPVPSLYPQTMSF